VTRRVAISTLAAAARLPTAHSTREYVEAGGLLSYGANYADLFWRARIGRWQGRPAWARCRGDESSKERTSHR
jgi:hypothetical protein